jgi:cell division protein FtsB
MESRPGKRPLFASRPESSSANVTSAVGMEEPVGRVRARRTSLFTQTVMSITGLICLALLFGTLAQAWSNNQLIQQLQVEQQKLRQEQAQHDKLAQAANHYQDPSVIDSEARQQLGYVRPGEKPVVIVGANTQSQTQTNQSTNTVQTTDFWHDWWHIFFGG